MLEGPQARKRKRKLQNGAPEQAPAPEPLVPNLRDSRAPGPVPAPRSPRRVTLAAHSPPSSKDLGTDGPGTDEAPALRRRAQRRR
ncbi:hypothetical protein [Deinococcus arcticus]|uniref:Uncharacterized protein n=1 Tax=Deinococcus arcticus TaxID=2136176 RepID=A0A2T3W8S1_9DEIO|nr:hypothetical protein [Deinococcus arcticus]PTA68301.1 hypothetical protein C8263_07590 [Deinococcus arcticus]